MELYNAHPGLYEVPHVINYSLLTYPYFIHERIIFRLEY